MGTIQKPADRKVVVLLPSAGVEVDERAPEQTTFQDIFKATEQAAHPATEERPAGPPFTVDDLIAFHFLLKDAENLPGLPSRLRPTPALPPSCYPPAVLPIVIVIAVGIVSTAIIAGIVVTLTRTVRDLSGSLAKYQQDIQPLLEDVRKRTERSQDLLERISNRRLGKGPGGRIRR
jgi:hypothetical protein